MSLEVAEERLLERAQFVLREHIRLRDQRHDVHARRQPPDELDVRLLVHSCAFEITDIWHNGMSGERVKIEHKCTLRRPRMCGGMK